MSTTARRPRIALCLEQTLGNRVHGRDLEAAAAAMGARADVHRVEYPEGSRMPVPWTVRGSAMALSAVRRARRRPAVTLFHTQSVSLFAPAAGSRYVISLDATPAQMDAMGRWYDHARRASEVESLKRRIYVEVFRRAAAFVAFSEWAAGSLCTDYGVAREKIHVLHPGAAQGFFEIARREERRRPNVLFVGGDLERKGGAQLLGACEAVADRASVTLVTGAEVAPRGCVRVLSGLTPGSPELMQAFAEADVFCLPTLGDCTPLVLGEAMAAGLPVITTGVGSNAETVRQGETGLIVAPGDEEALAEALRTLVDDAGLRRRMGRAAREDARGRMQAARNAARTIELLEAAA
jgi:glycosyltransferase involved in cell wall biosynthesis